MGPGWDSRVLGDARAALPPGAWVNPEPSYGSPQATEGATGASEGVPSSLPSSSAPQSGPPQGAPGDISSRGQQASGAAGAMECT